MHYQTVRRAMTFWKGRSVGWTTFNPAELALQHLPAPAFPGMVDCLQAAGFDLWPFGIVGGRHLLQVAIDKSARGIARDLVKAWQRDQPPKLQPYQLRAFLPPEPDPDMREARLYQGGKLISICAVADLKSRPFLLPYSAAVDEPYDDEGCPTEPRRRDNIPIIGI